MRGLALFAAIVIAAIIALLFASAVMGCVPSQPKNPAHCFDETLLKAKLVACVETSKTRSESHRCRAEAHRLCGFEAR